MALSRVVSEIFNIEKYCDLEILVKGQGTIQHTGYSFLLVLSIVTLSIFDFKNAVTSDLENRVRGQSRSLKVVPIDRPCMVSY